MAKRIKTFAFVLGVEALLRAARYFWRVELVGEPPDDKGPYLFAHWHGDELLLVPVYAGRGYAVMASRSQDGQAMAHLLSRLGYFVVRGSSSRGGAGGLKGLIDAVRQGGKTAAIAVDGPRGPVFQAKPGILLLAQATGLPVQPAAAFAQHRWSFGGWNRGFLPKPFSKCVVVYGDPIEVPPDATEDDRWILRARLENQLFELKKKAEALLPPKRVRRLQPSA